MKKYKSMLSKTGHITAAPSVSIRAKHTLYKYRLYCQVLVGKKKHCPTLKVFYTRAVTAIRTKVLKTSMLESGHGTQTAGVTGEDKPTCNNAFTPKNTQQLSA